MKMIRGLWILLMPVIAVADERVPVPPEVVACSAISRNSERLACFDHAIAALMSGKTESSAAASPETSFGLLSSTAAAPKINERNDLQSLQSTVKGFGRAEDGSLVVYLDNGQRWVQISGTDPLLKKGDTVTINRAALGSFQMVVPSRRAMKVRRIS